MDDLAMWLLLRGLAFYGILLTAGLMGFALKWWMRRIARSEAEWVEQECAREVAEELRFELREELRRRAEQRQRRRSGRAPSSMPFPISAMPNSPRATRRFARVQGGPARYWVGDELLVGGEPHRVEAVLYSGGEITYCTRAVEDSPAWTQQLGAETRPLPACTVPLVHEEDR